MLISDRRSRDPHLLRLSIRPGKACLFQIVSPRATSRPWERRLDWIPTRAVRRHRIRTNSIWRGCVRPRRQPTPPAFRVLPSFLKSHAQKRPRFTPRPLRRSVTTCPKRLLDWSKPRQARDPLPSNPATKSRRKGVVIALGKVFQAKPSVKSVYVRRSRRRMPAPFTPPRVGRQRAQTCHVRTRSARGMPPPRRRLVMAP